MMMGLMLSSPELEGCAFFLAMFAGAREWAAPKYKICLGWLLAFAH